jgi:adenylate kinase family enzyme
MAKGDMVSPKIIVDLLMSNIGRSKAKRFLIDGFPRDV